MHDNFIVPLAILLSLMALFYSVQKGLNQIISGLTVISKQLSKLEKQKDKEMVWRDTNCWE